MQITQHLMTICTLVAKIAHSIGLTLWAHRQDQDAIASLDGLEVSESSFDEWAAVVASNPA